MIPAAVGAGQTRGWVHDSTARVSGQKVRAQSAVLDEMSVVGRCMVVSRFPSAAAIFIMRTRFAIPTWCIALNQRESGRVGESVGRSWLCIWF
ncbi:hypothetical protein KC351_g50 [Hortaea werneckii]|nr:hypothetical protein KC351_g50 [Hortaea werneckii]